MLSKIRSSWGTGCGIATLQLRALEHVLATMPSCYGLNLGSGDGRASQLLRQRYHYKMVDVDICDTATTEVKPILYNGKYLPFADKAFDFILISYVLHHILADAQLNILFEAKRVLKPAGKILIIEDVVDGVKDKMCSYLHMLSSYFLFKNAFHSMQFRSDQAWQALFLLAKLSILQQGIINTHGWAHFFYPIKHKYYFLEKK